MMLITCPIKYPLSFNISKQVLRTRNNLVALSKADPSMNNGLTVTQRVFYKGYRAAGGCSLNRKLFSCAGIATILERWLRMDSNTSLK